MYSDLASVGQSEGLLIPRSSVRFRLIPGNSNSHEFELHRPSNKGTKLLLKVIKAIIIIITNFRSLATSLYGIGGVQFAISRVPVYTAISIFKCRVLNASE